ncbi:MAG: DUF2442 domain-containing protein [Cyanobacteria bacterium J06634_5]
MGQLTKKQIREAQIDQAIAAGNAFKESQSVAVAGSYDMKTQKIIIELASGAEYRFPAKLGQGLENASEAELSNIKISPSGLGIHWPDIDIGFSIPHLLEGIYGNKRWMSSLTVSSRSGA